MAAVFSCFHGYPDLTPLYLDHVLRKVLTGLMVEQPSAVVLPSLQVVGTLMAHTPDVFLTERGRTILGMVRRTATDGNSPQVRQLAKELLSALDSSASSTEKTEQ